MKRTLVTTALAAVLALAGLAAVVGSARATYPGATNGRIAFGINVGGNTDVYTARPDGQALRRLTTDPGFDACAAYSADGRRIAYCSGQGSFTANLASSTATSNGRTTRIRTAHTDAGSARRLGLSADRDRRCSGMTPDGRY
jgi:Tol biopolymer transport system component